MSKSDALKLEYRVKQVPSIMKIIELKKGKDETAMNLKKELQKIGKEITALTKKFEKLVVETGKVEKSNPKNAKAKLIKKAPAKMADDRKPAESAAEQVLAVIDRSKKGLDTSALMDKTGYNGKKIQNIVFRLRKQGKIKAEKKGLYVKA